MPAKSTIAAGVAGGYLLGRTKKLRLAMTLAGMLAGQRLTSGNKSGSGLLGANAQLDQLRGMVTGRLAEVAREAALSAVAGRVETMTKALQGGSADAAEQEDVEQEDVEQEDEQGAEEVEDQGAAVGEESEEDTEEEPEAQQDEGEESEEEPAKRPARTAKTTTRSPAKKATKPAPRTAKKTAKKASGTAAATSDQTKRVASRVASPSRTRAGK